MYAWFYILFSFLSKLFKCNTHTHTLIKFFVIINGYMNIMGCSVLG